MPSNSKKYEIHTLNDGEQRRGEWISGADREDIISILDNAPLGIAINCGRGNGDVLYINRETFNLIGYRVSEVPTGRAAQKKFLENRERLQEIKQFENSLLTTGKAFGARKIITRSGELKHLEIYSVRLPSENVVSMWIDVTRRDKAEKELRESETKFRTLFEHSLDAVLLLRDGYIIDCNNAAEALFHTVDRERILHRSLDQLSPVRQADGRRSTECAGEQLSNAIKNKNLRFEWRLKRFDGEIFSAEAAVTGIQLQGQDVLHVVLRDITAWKNAEQGLLEARDRLEERVDERTSELRAVNQQLRREILKSERMEKELEQSREELRLLSEHLQRAREKERERIAREVHDELGQFLSALKIDVACLAKSAQSDPEEFLNQTCNIEQQIDHAIHSVRHICSELRPPILFDFGLPAAIEWYLCDFQKRTGIRCVANIDQNISKKKKALWLMLFRVFQEAMTNILRHAEATKVDVDLKITSGKITLRVKDNGTGITKSQMADPRSFGIAGIRERVRFWGGYSRFEGSPNKGTTMTVIIPINKKEKTLL